MNSNILYTGMSAETNTAGQTPFLPGHLSAAAFFIFSRNYIPHITMTLSGEVCGGMLLVVELYSTTRVFPPGFP